MSLPVTSLPGALVGLNGTETNLSGEKCERDTDFDDDFWVHYKAKS